MGEPPVGSLRTRCRTTYSPTSHRTVGASAQDTPVWMAKVLAAGVGARRVQVWLLAGGRIRLAAVHPESDGEPPAPPELSERSGTGAWPARPIRPAPR